VLSVSSHRRAEEELLFQAVCLQMHKNSPQLLTQGSRLGK